jgi:hypothetical protein
VRVPTVTAILEYDGKQYTHTDDHWDVELLWPGQDPDDQQHELEGLVWYMWVQGNYSCDCNRLDFIEDVDPDFPVKADENGWRPCGETVHLASLSLDGKDLLAPTPREVPMDARARLTAMGLVGL